MKTLSSLCRVALVALLLAGQRAAAQESVEIDIALCYAPSYATSVGGEANARVGLANSVSGVNEVYARCGAGVRWHIAGYYQSGETANQTTTGGMAGW